jgi:hypothetical protein
MYIVLSFVCLFGFYDTIQVISRRSSFTGGGRPQVPFRALFQARTGTGVEQPTSRKLAGQLHHIKEYKVPLGIRTHNGEGQVLLLLMTPIH